MLGGVVAESTEFARRDARATGDENAVVPWDDFGNQRRVKVETYHDGNPWDFPEGVSLYVSSNYELRNVEYDNPTNTYGGENLIHARYARDGLATTWELDSEGPGGTDSGKYRRA